MGRSHHTSRGESQQQECEKGICERCEFPPFTLVDNIVSSSSSISTTSVVFNLLLGTT